MSKLARRHKLLLAFGAALLLHLLWLLPWRGLPPAGPAQPGTESVLSIAAAPATAPALAPASAQLSRVEAGRPVAEAIPAERPEPAPAAPTAATSPAPGTAAISSYSETVRQQLARYVVDLPRSSGGEARVRFTVAANGAVSDVQLAASSGDPALDAAALALPARAAPLPSPGANALRLEAPVRAEALR